VKFDGNYPRWFLQFRKTRGGQISPIAARKVENSGNQHHVGYVLSAINPILDELLKEFRYELLDNTVVDKEGDCNPTRDIEELERLLAKYHQSFFTEIKVPSWIVKTNKELEPFIHIQQFSPLYGVFKLSKSLSKPCKVKFDGNYPRWFFKEDVSTIWKDDRRSDKSYSREKSGKFRKSTSVCSLETLMRLNSSTRDTEGFKRLVIYAKCNRDSYETTNPILDELLKVFGYELLDNIVVDKEGDCNPTWDIEEIERVLAKYHQLFFTEIKVP
ncbi:hypothetical protein Tco_0697272, partial [Tanacetum coccineum]